MHSPEKQHCQLKISVHTTALLSLFIILKELVQNKAAGDESSDPSNSYHFFFVTPVVTAPQVL